MPDEALIEEGGIQTPEAAAVAGDPQASAEIQPEDQAAEQRTVKIACSMPNGLVLDLDGFEKIDGDIRRVTRGDRVTLRGLNAEGVTGSYAYTDVPADFWDAWLESHQDSTLVRDGVVRAMPDDPAPHEVRPADAEAAVAEPEAAAEPDAAEAEAGEHA